MAHLRSRRAHRRHVGVAVLVAWLCVVALACRAEPPAAGARSMAIGGARVLLVMPAHPDPAAPLVVALHGRGGSPERIVDLWQAADVPYEVAAIEGFLPYAHGAEWFLWPDIGDVDKLADAIAEAEARLWSVITTLARGRPIIVTGFSQGAVMTYVLAARHPEIRYAFPIAGLLPGRLSPTVRGAPVYALHGADDVTIGVEEGRRAVAAFAARGGPAELRAFEGVGHRIPDAMRADLLAHIAAALR